MNTAIIQSALSMPPDRPGVGRLCQELLSELTGDPITASVEKSVRVYPRKHVSPRAKTEGIAA